MKHGDGDGTYVILPVLGRMTSTFGFELYDPALGRPPADCIAFDLMISG